MQRQFEELRGELGRPSPPQSGDMAA